MNFMESGPLQDQIVLLQPDGTVRIYIQGGFAEYVPRLKWTREKPTVPGDYFIGLSSVRTDGTETGKMLVYRVHEVYRDQDTGELLCRFSDRVIHSVSALGGYWWAGPIPLPSRPDEEAR